MIQRILHGFWGRIDLPPKPHEADVTQGRWVSFDGDADRVADPVPEKRAKALVPLTPRKGGMDCAGEHETTRA